MARKLDEMPPRITEEDTAKSIELAGNLARAVAICVELDRRIWHAVTSGDPPRGRTKSNISLSLVTDFARGLLDEFKCDHSLLKLLSQAVTLRYNTGGSRKAPNQLRPSLIGRPANIASALLPHVAYQDIRYYVRRNIREKYRQLSPANLTGPFRQMAHSFNCRRLSARSTPQWRGPLREFELYLKQGLARARIRESAEESVLANLFVECCRNVGYLVPIVGSPGDIIVGTPEIDVEYLLGHLFGFPTGIPGFDDLFGGGGLLLSERGYASGDRMDGRAVLVKGRFGSGKSILALQLCAEVAQKGGVARFVALEQSPAECRHMMESVGILPDVARAAVITNPQQLGTLVGQAAQVGAGILGIVDGRKDSASAFFDALEVDSESAASATLSLVAVDPINAIQNLHSATGGAAIRAKFLQTLSKVKADGTNVLFVVEETAERPANVFFEENIVDTVIRLSDQHAHGYSRRQFEIQKSRLQRECRGEHVYGISSESGFYIYPSAAAVDSRIQRRRIREPNQKNVIRFGVPEMDHVLGENAFYLGDVIAFRGSTGSYKTYLGILFLLNVDLHRPETPGYSPRKSLLVAARDSEVSLRKQLRSDWVRKFRSRMQGHPLKSIDKGDIEICSLPVSYVEPGLVLQRIEAEFDKALREGALIDRVMVTNIAHWSLSCPFVREDETFADTLVNLMRRRGVTSLFVCGDFRDTSDMQQPILDHADVVLQFEKMEIQGEQRITLRATKTREMEHSKQRFEVSLKNKELTITPTTDLLRRSVSGEAASVPIRLIVHAESAAQKAYNLRWRETLSTVLSQDTEIKAAGPFHASGTLFATQASALDELQIVQVDEYEAPRQSGKEHSGEGSWAWPLQLPSVLSKDKAFLDLLCEGLTLRADGAMLAVPYYADVGVLAYRHDLCPNAATVDSWEGLADLQADWTARNHDQAADAPLFFDYPQDTEQNFCSLFLEMISEVSEPWRAALGEPGNPKKPVRMQSLLEELRTDCGLRAVNLFWRLGRPSWLKRTLLSRPTNENLLGSFKESQHGSGLFDGAETEGEPECKTFTNAVIWRQWYTTLYQMTNAMMPENREHLRVRAVPGGRGVSGEWFLCIPKHSAARETGLEIIRRAVLPEAEIERLRLGVGLPVRKAFYPDAIKGDETNCREQGASPSDIPSSTGPIVGFGNLLIDAADVRKQLDGAIKRSRLPGYAHWSSSLGTSLRMILSISEDGTAWRNAVDRILAAASKSILYSGKAD
jgi:KaiC/GvpD/RAD55 family RecA-like ATPase